MFPVFFYILVLGDLDSNFLYYGQPFLMDVGAIRGDAVRTIRRKMWEINDLDDGIISRCSERAFA